MNIVVIGAGAMGSLFGALLFESGHRVHLVSKDEAHIQAIREKGLVIEYQGAFRTVVIPASVYGDDIPQADLCLIFVKSPDTAQAAEDASRIAGDQGMVLTLQNGLGNADILARFMAKERILAGTTAHGATFLEPGRIRHAGVGPTVIGTWSGSNGEPARQVSDAFNNAGIATDLLDDIQTVIWNKLLINVGINAVTALTGIKNGGILDLEDTRQLCQAAVNEARTVAEAKGIAVNPNAVETVFKVARATCDNRSSMGQDVDKRRPTEIDAINGAVADMAEKLNIPAPINTTLTALVRTLQAHYAS